MLFDCVFGLQPLQLQDALKCQQCHKQFRSKAGLNYHTMAEHTTKVHPMTTQFLKVASKVKWSSLKQAEHAASFWVIFAP